jgi:hypothetical protein
MVIHFDHIWLLNWDHHFQFLGMIDKTQGMDTSTRRGNSDTFIIPSADNIAFAINSIIECASFFFSLELHLIPMELCQCDPFSLYLMSH